MTPRAALFDLDGTLLDTLVDIAASMNEALASSGLAVHQIESYKTFVGNGVTVLVERAVPRATSVEKKQEVEEAYRRIYSSRWDRETRPYPGIPELLDGLAARGVPSFVLSNKPQAATVLAVEKFLGRWKFAGVWGEREGVPLKPAPNAALEAARVLGVEPCEVLYCGDTGTDMETAVAAGMYPVGALWGFRSREELLDRGAKALVSRPEELLDLL